MPAATDDDVGRLSVATAATVGSVVRLHQPPYHARLAGQLIADEDDSYSAERCTQHGCQCGLMASHCMYMAWVTVAL